MGKRLVSIHIQRSIRPDADLTTLRGLAPLEKPSSPRLASSITCSWYSPLLDSWASSHIPPSFCSHLTSAPMGPTPRALSMPWKYSSGRLS